MSFAIPEGVTNSICPVPFGGTTWTFTMPEGIAVVTFNPVDMNNPGTVTLYDSGANTILTMQAGGWYSFEVPPGGASYYFTATNGAATLAATRINNPSRPI